MKKWQHGFDIDYLLEIERKFERYNKNARGPFEKVSKNAIAALLHEGRLEEWDGCIISSFITKSSGKFNMLKGVPFARKAAGDRIIKAFDWTSRNRIIDALNKLAEETRTWVWICIEDAEYVKVVKQCDYLYFGSRFSSNGSIFGLYCSHEDFDFSVRVSKEEHAGLRKIGEGIDVSVAEELLAEYPLSLFVDHYSNYNVGHSWSGISLQGYSPDIRMIERPEAMSDKWREDNKDVELRLQETELMERYPDIADMYLEWFDGCKLDRVRLLALTAGGGTLERHTDQVGNLMGLKDGDLARFHIPIVTNEKVIVSSWDRLGNETKRHMGKGECWYLDIRKPHKAVNKGTDVRVHLVFDVYVDEHVRSLL